MIRAISGKEWWQPMLRFPLRPADQVRLLRAVAVLGVVTALVVGLAGWMVLGQAQRALGDSLQLTADTLEALDASAGVAGETIAALGTSLAVLEQTSADLDVAFADGERLMAELSGLVRTDVAGTLDAVEGALPGVVDVARSIDTTLSALSLLPFGPTYDPAEPFAASLQDVATAIDGVPERLREQADVIDETAVSLGAVGQGVGDLSSQLVDFEETLAATAELLATYDQTIEEGSALVADAGEGLEARLWLGRLALVLFAVSFAAMQVVPLHLAAVAEQRMRERDQARTTTA
jgi:methyl-accepting chemotaxis protein